MRRSLAKFSESEASNHTPSWADFTTTTPELKFSVHTGYAVMPTTKVIICALRMRNNGAARQRLFDSNGGFLFAADPEKAFDKQPIFWAPEALSTVLSLREAYA